MENLSSNLLFLENQPQAKRQYESEKNVHVKKIFVQLLKKKTTKC